MIPAPLLRFETRRVMQTSLRLERCLKPPRQVKNRFDRGQGLLLSSSRQCIAKRYIHARGSVTKVMAQLN